MTCYFLFKKNKINDVSLSHHHPPYYKKTKKKPGGIAFMHSHIQSSHKIILTFFA